MNEYISIIESPLYNKTRTGGVLIARIDGQCTDEDKRAASQPALVCFLTGSRRACPVCNEDNVLMYREPDGCISMRGGADVTCKSCGSLIEIRPANDSMHVYVDGITIPLWYVDSADLCCDVI